jgi:ribonuclease HI
LDFSRVFGLRKRVYVDAKIVGIEKEPAQRRAYVAFVTKGREDLSGAEKVEASETDEAEEQGVLFAIRELQKRSIRKFTVVCDHESAVTKINWKGDDRNKARKDKVVGGIWSELDRNPSIKVVSLQSNPAHAFLNKSLKERGWDT